MEFEACLIQLSLFIVVLYIHTRYHQLQMHDRESYQSFLPVLGTYYSGSNGMMDFVMFLAARKCRMENELGSEIYYWWVSQHSRGRFDIRGNDTNCDYEFSVIFRTWLNRCYLFSLSGSPLGYLSVSWFLGHLEKR